MHKSVLIKETLEYLKCEKKKVILDCTVGCGGHAKEILKKLPLGAKLIGIDADKKALEIAEENLKDFKGSYVLVHENFRNLDKVLAQLNIRTVDAMLFDLGISSFQLEDTDRGFSFSKDSILDMRMDTTLGKPLWKIINNMSEKELGYIIKDLGEERLWHRIAWAIVTERRKQPIKDTYRLAYIIRRAVRYKEKGRIDPATKTFQAFRILVNDELGALKEALSKVTYYLSKNGRAVVISFHSLEDRIVKYRFRKLEKEGPLTILTKKPITPGKEEKKENPRSRSAKLRAAQRL
ncbi:MAG: 16S rRNA (cytosine(1402)-N(4))-methyltransferase RsmH [Candidatus Omnitrophota bacterium]